MPATNQGPTHFRLISKLKAVGPYLREPQSQEGHYYFDCLSVCVDDKKSPEKREFWGWWMDLEASESGFTAKYHIGKYNKEGIWVSEPLPENVVKEVYVTQSTFHQKLVDTLEKHFKLQVDYHTESFEFA
ncbi:sigma factor-binding protein Crl [Vibrio sagamiensis]|uniref:Sigma factor-binding protein Crl n=1 Tax=Vibrio sagamiensis NBRC 104589 TaxID=1219064 RepID=A0A511QEL1_9VIBR|nr:sigma factor-binding protein Crl [Vibrio sagamiensis]PNQ70825.1 Crl family RNA polymerase assembly factor [Vibrio agarivorans]GEM75627.1 sigma factor-binding protein Crl [Vibrio sagamiensis NBRC 104589]